MVLALALASVALVTVAAPSAGAVAGGRVTLQPAMRGLDTRNAGASARVTTQALGSGLLHVWFTEATAAGSATLHRCGQAPGLVPLVVFEAGETVYAKVIAADSCLTMSTPTHVIVDHIGTVADTPSADALQYVPLPAPREVFDAVIARSVTPTGLDLGSTPAAARAAVVLIEVNDPIGAGFLRVAPCQGSALAADVAWQNDRAVGIVYVDVMNGPLCVHPSGEAGVRLTVLGHLSVEGPDATRLPPTLSAPVTSVRLPGLRALSPIRLVDTRSGLGISGARPLAAGETLELTISQAAASTTAVALNVTVTDPAATGFLTAFPCDQNRPKASNLNYVAGETVPNLVNVKVSITRSVCFFAQQSTHLIVDLAGTFETGGGAGAQPSAPVRLLDTRTPVGVPNVAKVAGGEVLTLQVAGRGGVPATGASAITMNVTVTEPDGEGFVTVYPCDRDRPTASNLNYGPGQTVPNLVSVRLSAAGTVCLFTQRTTHLVADLATWYSVDEEDGFRELVPDRVLDTREGIGAPSAKMQAGSVLTLQVAGRGGVPAGGASAVTMNVTVTEAVGEGFVTVYPCDRDRPTASNLNHTAGETVPNLVTVQLSSSGTVCLFAQRSLHLLADVAGYFSAATELRNSAVVSGG